MGQKLKKVVGVGLALMAFPGSGALLASLPQGGARLPPAPGSILTVAGNGKTGFSGDGGPAAEAALYYPLGVGVDSVGTHYIGTLNDYTRFPYNRGSRVRRVTPDGTITTIAGSGQIGFSGDGGPALAADLDPVDVRVDAAGDLYIADAANDRVRRVDVTGTITTVAGGGSPAHGVGDGGPATSALLDHPTGVALDDRSNLFIVEHLGHRVRRVTPEGLITTVAGIGKPGSVGDGGPATAARLNSPITVAADNAGHVYIADTANHRVRMVGPDGTIHTVAGGGSPSDALGDGGLATEARLDAPTGVALDGAGNLFIADADGRRIRQVGPGGIISTVAGTGQSGFSGDGGPANQALVSGPFNLAMDQAGNLYFCDVGTYTGDSPGNARIREVTGVGVPA